MNEKDSYKVEQKHIALIEIGGSHDECLYSQIAVLKHGGYKVHLIIDDKLAKRIGNDAQADQLTIVTLNNSSWNNWGSLFSIRNLLKKNKIRKAVINTAEGKRVRNLCFIIGSETEITGILHNGKKLLKSGTQRMIARRIKKFFVLNDYILESIKNIKPGLKTESFYPVFFPSLKIIELHKKENECWVCIPGQVEIKRRDYAGLLQALKNNKKSISKDIKFILLGNGSHAHGNGNEVKAMVQEAGLAAQFIFFDTFITNEVFYSYLSYSDIIMPLIHPGTDGFESYLHYQISGTYNLAFGFAKPMLVHEAFKDINDLQQTSWFYKTGEIPEKLEILLSQKEALKQKEAEIAAMEKFSLPYQSKKYIDFIEND